MKVEGDIAPQDRGHSGREIKQPIQYGKEGLLLSEGIGVGNNEKTEDCGSRDAYSLKEAPDEQKLKGGYP